MIQHERHILTAGPLLPFHADRAMVSISKHQSLPRPHAHIQVHPLPHGPSDLAADPRAASPPQTAGHGPGSGSGSGSGDESSSESGAKHRCPDCGKEFRRVYDLNRHVKLHTGVKPHVCSRCGKRFSRADALIRHMRPLRSCAQRSLEAARGAHGFSPNANAGATLKGEEGSLTPSQTPAQVQPQSQSQSQGQPQAVSVGQGQVAAPQLPLPQINQVVPVRSPTQMNNQTQPHMSLSVASVLSNSHPPQVQAQHQGMAPQAQQAQQAQQAIPGPQAPDLVRHDSMVGPGTPASHASSTQSAADPRTASPSLSHGQAQPQLANHTQFPSFGKTLMQPAVPGQMHQPPSQPAAASVAAPAQGQVQAQPPSLPPSQHQSQPQSQAPTPTLSHQAVNIKGQAHSMPVTPGQAPAPMQTQGPIQALQNVGSPSGQRMVPAFMTIPSMGPPGGIRQDDVLAMMHRMQTLEARVAVLEQRLGHSEGRLAFLETRPEDRPAPVEGRS